MPCKEYQEGKCSKQSDRDIGLITHKHICISSVHREKMTKRGKKRTKTTPTAVDSLIRSSKGITAVGQCQTVEIGNSKLDHKLYTWNDIHGKCNDKEKFNVCRNNKEHANETTNSNSTLVSVTVVRMRP